MMRVLPGPSALSLGLACLACHGRAPEVVESGATVHDTAIVRESCDGERAERYDVDEDGKPEVVLFKEGEREVCRRMDFDDDGHADRTTFFDEAGRVRRIESDFDRDQRVDEIATFDGGVLKEKHRATVLRGQLDTWEYYERGVRVRSERDADGDGVVDQWWDYRRGECPLIHSDVNGDGLADPGSTIDYCKEVGEGGFREGGSGQHKPDDDEPQPRGEEDAS
jgi:hypothetical protein